MNAPSTSVAIPTATPHVGLLRPWQAWILAGLAGLGLVALGVGLAVATQRTWMNLLLSNFYFVAVAVTGGLFIAIQYLASGGWHTVFRRVPEAMTAYLPVGAVLMIALLFGLHSLYEWSHADMRANDPVMHDRAWFMNPVGFGIRMVVVLGLWIWLARGLVKRSVRQDVEGTVELTAANVKHSAIYALVFAVTFSLASVDWLMSLEPHWYSTIYPWYVFSTVFVSTLCWMVMLVSILRWRGDLREVNEHHIHDLGKYVFAFSMFWGYLWLCQYLLIWYANIPEETPHYIVRMQGPWIGAFFANIAVNTVLPFFFLLPARCKQNGKLLFGAAAVLALGHWLDLYLLIVPAVVPKGPVFGWIEICVFLGLGAGFLLVADRAMRRAAVMPVQDPYLVESRHFHGV